MARQQLKRYKSSSRLLKRLTDNPALPAFVRSLNQPSLKQLIREVGVADAAALIEHTSEEQSTQLFDDVSWKVVVPGQPEVFDPPEFLNWLEALLSVNDAFCVERLVALGEDFLAYALAHFLGATDLSTKVLDDHEKVMPGSSAETMEMYGDYQVSARHDDEWYLLRHMLDALHEHEPELLQVLLARCLPPASMIENDPNVLAHDAQYEHMKNREARGYVTPESARAFLRQAIDDSLDELAYMDAYDLESGRYFRLVQAAGAPPSAATAQPETDPEEENNAEASAGDIEEALQALEDLVAASITPESELVGQVGLLEGPSGEPIEENRLRALMDSLGETDPQRLQTLMGEAAYLSNVLMTGSSIDGRRIEEEDALPATLAVCNLGLDYLDEPNLDNAAGLVRLFRTGWNILQGLQLQAARALVQAVNAVDPEGSTRAWMFEDVKATLTDPKFLEAVTQSAFEEAQQSIQLLALVMQEDQLFALEGLISDLPRKFTGSERKDEGLQKHYRYIDSLNDLDWVEQVLAETRTRFELGNS